MSYCDKCQSVPTLSGNPDLTQQRESGAVYLEFLLTVPVVLVIFFGTIAVYRILEQQQLSSLLSREVAHHAFRECREGNPDVNQCLKTVIANFKSNQVQAEFALSVYQCTKLPNGQCSFGKVPQQIGTYQTIRTMDTHYANLHKNPDRTEPNNLAKIAIREAFLDGGWVYVSETIVRYDAIARLLAGGSAHETTVY